MKNFIHLTIINMKKAFKIFVFDSRNTGFYFPSRFSSVLKARNCAKNIPAYNSKFRIEGPNGFFEEWEAEEKTSWSNEDNKKWVCGNRYAFPAWYRVGPEDRDYEKGFTDEDVKKHGFDGLAKIWNKPSLI